MYIIKYLITFSDYWRISHVLLFITCIMWVVYRGFTTPNDFFLNKEHKMILTKCLAIFQLLILLHCRFFWRQQQNYTATLSKVDCYLTKQTKCAKNTLKPCNTLFNSNFWFGIQTLKGTIHSNEPVDLWPLVSICWGVLNIYRKAWEKRDNRWWWLFVAE